MSENGEARWGKSSAPFPRIPACAFMRNPRLNKARRYLKRRNQMVICWNGELYLILPQHSCGLIAPIKSWRHLLPQSERERVQ